MSRDATQAAQALAALSVLRDRADAFFDRVLAAHRTEMRCGPGCSSCCRSGLSVFSVEAASLREALALLEQRDPVLRGKVRAQADAELSQSGVHSGPLPVKRCALLVDDRCATYEARPLICRTHGLPTIDSDREPLSGAVEIDDASTGAPSRRSIRGLPIVHCELNFAAPSPIARQPSDAPEVRPQDAERASVEPTPLRSENVMDLAALNRPLAVIAELYEAGAPRLRLAELAR